MESIHPLTALVVGLVILAAAGIMFWPHGGLLARWRASRRGPSRALRVIRVHRLWEHHLADESGLQETEWHDDAERHEHSLTPLEADALAARLGTPAVDPHGDPNP